ncbi:hypothetical protein JQ634_00970 [Bradyrhizobium sp. AUGA SZCCT0240]|uniref:hypothetical protein n=1 Tax=Bradyrhizobium sp. AUGA SZCCT0240 TaxID=2807669 RepID=UPI001BABEDD6|nr:hypothetical protein [Bradyrhizobium sp. AUGA SZCCT0240]MBR1252269.1 hypothetical protein [Bradyrhizobium sp. AUGA SZCCT0240]
MAIAGLLTAMNQIAVFFGLVGEKQVHLEIREIIPIIYSSYEREGDVVVAVYVRKTGQKTAINCRLDIHADGRPTKAKPVPQSSLDADPGLKLITERTSLMRTER